MSEEPFPCPEGEPTSSLVVTPPKAEPSPELLCLHKINAALAEHGCELVPRITLIGGQTAAAYDIQVVRKGA